MKTEELNYTLPAELIAQTPSSKRADSRLLALNRRDGSLEDRLFRHLPEYLAAGDCLVLNNTKVIPARFYAQKITGAKLEGLFIATETDGRWQVLLKNARKLNPGDTIALLGRDRQPWTTATATPSPVPGQWLLEPDSPIDSLEALEHIGFAPLPPYIKRNADDGHLSEDLEHYQTIFAKQPGAVAAPTAGLHFDDSLLMKIREIGVRIAYVTLHVGIGTFRPVQTATLDEHPMHEEYYEITPEAAEIINKTTSGSGRVIAVGTTSVRTLESVAKNRKIRPAQGKTRLFIKPGYDFQIVDAMVTNFHLPKSTLLALVGAFAGMETIMNAYQHAIKHKYRFYSYGDAMFIL